MSTRRYAPTKLPPEAAGGGRDAQESFCARHPMIRISRPSTQQDLSELDCPRRRASKRRTHQLHNDATDGRDRSAARGGVGKNKADHHQREDEYLTSPRPRETEYPVTPRTVRRGRGDARDVGVDGNGEADAEKGGPRKNGRSRGPRNGTADGRDRSSGSVGGRREACRETGRESGQEARGEIGRESGNQRRPAPPSRGRMASTTTSTPALSGSERRIRRSRSRSKCRRSSQASGAAVVEIGNGNAAARGGGSRSRSRSRYTKKQTRSTAIGEATVRYSKVSMDSVREALEKQRQQREARKLRSAGPALLSDECSTKATTEGRGRSLSSRRSRGRSCSLSTRRTHRSTRPPSMEDAPSQLNHKDDVEDNEGRGRSASSRRSRGRSCSVSTRRTHRSTRPPSAKKAPSQLNHTGDVEDNEGRGKSVSSRRSRGRSCSVSTRRTHRSTRPPSMEDAPSQLNHRDDGKDNHSTALVCHQTVSWRARSRSTATRRDKSRSRTSAEVARRIVNVESLTTNSREQSAPTINNTGADIALDLYSKIKQRRNNSTVDRKSAFLRRKEVERLISEATPRETNTSSFQRRSSSPSRDSLCLHVSPQPKVSHAGQGERSPWEVTRSNGDGMDMHRSSSHKGSRSLWRQHSFNAEHEEEPHGTGYRRRHAGNDHDDWLHGKLDGADGSLLRHCRASTPDVSTPVSDNGECATPDAPAMRDAGAADEGSVAIPRRRRRPSDEVASAATPRGALESFEGRILARRRAILDQKRDGSPAAVPRRGRSGGAAGGGRERRRRQQGMRHDW